MTTSVIDKAAEFERFRGRLFGLAYRMLGDAHEAEDMVQETYLRWAAAEPVQAPEGWLVTVIGRLAIDRLRRVETTRLQYVGHWLPEPIPTSDPPPDHVAELDSDLSVALVILLERLSPVERVAFLLREVFDADYREIAAALDRSDVAVRQMIHRARERVRSGRARFAVPPRIQERIVRQLVHAIREQDKEGIIALFDESATFASDGGGRVAAARRVLVGPDRISRFLLGIERRWGAFTRHHIRSVNGYPAMVTTSGPILVGVTSFATDGVRIAAAYRVMNPEKLARFSA